MTKLTKVEQEIRKKMEERLILPDLKNGKSIGKTGWTSLFQQRLYM